MSDTPRSQDKITDWPGYWFLLLERYLKVGDLEGAAVARRELERLGVQVRYHSLSPAREEGKHA